MQHFYESIHGFFNYQNVYKQMINKASLNARFAEIGVWKGRSICYAAVEIINSGKNITIDAIDTWQGSPREPIIMGDESLMRGTLYNEFITNIQPVKHIINVNKMDSVAAAQTYEDKTFDFVFIDGSHLYEAVCNDIRAWLPKVKPGGYIGGHDYDGSEDFNGVARAVTDIFEGQDINLFNLGWASWLKRV